MASCLIRYTTTHKPPMGEGHWHADLLALTFRNRPPVCDLPGRYALSALSVSDKRLPERSRAGRCSRRHESRRRVRGERHPHGAGGPPVSADRRIGRVTDDVSDRGPPPESPRRGRRRRAVQPFAGASDLTVPVTRGPTTSATVRRSAQTSTKPDRQPCTIRCLCQGRNPGSGGDHISLPRRPDLPTP